MERLLRSDCHIAAWLSSEWVFPGSNLHPGKVIHNVARLIHIVAAESERDTHFMLETETSTHGHVMLRKSDFRHFMLQFATLCACYKVASGHSQRPCYASQARPFFRENHTESAKKDFS